MPRFEDDVDITSVVPGTGATNLGKPISTAVGATDTGVGALAMVNMVPTSLASDGEWTPIATDTYGQTKIHQLDVGNGSGLVFTDSVYYGAPTIHVGAYSLDNTAPHTVYSDAYYNILVRSFGSYYQFNTTHSSTTTSANVDSASVLNQSGGNGPGYFKHYSFTVNPVGGTVTAWSVTLQGSIDGTTFTTIVTHTQANGAGTTVFPANPAGIYPYRYLNTICTLLTLGTGTGVQTTVLATQ